MVITYVLQAHEVFVGVILGVIFGVPVGVDVLIGVTLAVGVFVIVGVGVLVLVIVVVAYRDWETDRKSTRLNSSHSRASRMPSSA